MLPKSLAFDSSPLNYFARAGLVDVLRELVVDSRCYMTRAVQDELLRGGSRYAQLYQAASADWIEVVDEAGIGYLQLFSEYHRVLGSAGKNVGEATTLAYAEVRGVAAVVDERAATRLAVERRVVVVSSLKIVAEGIRQGKLTENDAAAVVDLLRDHEAYLPCSGAEFVAWARSKGLLD